MDTPQEQLAAMAARYEPAIAARGLAAIERLRARMPGAHRLIYDNYNALAVGFAHGDRAKDAFVSIAFYPRWVTLFFLYGKGLDDPEGLLKGDGARVRHVVLDDVDDLERPAIVALLDQVLDQKDPPPLGEGPLIIKAVSEKQRPRRPG
ncbi:DUF1801 domain-containing protein [Caulobacter sp. 1776]|uniref:DUF1801 domain-containing protein n=1 Tax=Caulobacter sp. 1776 TaxID=3156420 RepID=UPI003390CABE